MKRPFTLVTPLKIKPFLTHKVKEKSKYAPPTKDQVLQWLYDWSKEKSKLSYADRRIVDKKKELIFMKHPCLNRATFGISFDFLTHLFLAFTDPNLHAEDRQYRIDVCNAFVRGVSASIDFYLAVYRPDALIYKHLQSYGTENAKAFSQKGVDALYLDNYIKDFDKHNQWIFDNYPGMREYYLFSGVNTLSFNSVRTVESVTLDFEKL